MRYNCFLSSPSLSLSSLSMDKMHLTLSELCTAFVHYSDFIVFDHIIVPAEFLMGQLEIRLTKYE